MRVVLLGSGRGSNAEAILKAQGEGRLGRAQVVAIFTDKPDAPMLALGPRFGVPAQFVDPRRSRPSSRAPARSATSPPSAPCAPDLVVLAGFMRVLKPGFLDAFAGRIINLHPSLLPSFPGLDGIGQAFRHGVKITGCTVHEVNAAVDGGRILDQEAVRIEEADTVETLAARIHVAEHRLLPAVIARLSGA
ncbi:MAG: phosphoribosylglycinamide formyltransferase [Opitutaceae bacterium]|nr:phosphoribosylglycinamide formyltransferase [Opitutaceae bacterium]